MTTAAKTVANDVAAQPEPLNMLALAIRHPAHDISVSCEVAYWLESNGIDASYHHDEIVRSFDRHRSDGRQPSRSDRCLSQ